MIKMLMWALIFAGLYTFWRAKYGTKPELQQDLRDRSEEPVIDVEAEVVEVEKERR